MPEVIFVNHIEKLVVENEKAWGGRADTSLYAYMANGNKELLGCWTDFALAVKEHKKLLDFACSQEEISYQISAFI